MGNQTVGRYFRSNSESELLPSNTNPDYKFNTPSSLEHIGSGKLQLLKTGQLPDSSFNRVKTALLQNGDVLLCQHVRPSEIWYGTPSLIANQVHNCLFNVVLCPSCRKRKIYSSSISVIVQLFSGDEGSDRKYTGTNYAS